MLPDARLYLVEMTPDPRVLFQGGPSRTSRLKDDADSLSLISFPESDPQVKMLVTRLCLATRLNCLARSLPSAISSLALVGVDRLLKASVAGCAGLASLSSLTIPVQERSLLASRFGGVLPGSVVVSPASFVSTVAAVERSLSTLGHGHDEGGELPSALQRVRDRITSREVGGLTRDPSPLETLLLGDIAVINEADADPEFRELRASSSRGGDERLREVAADEESPAGGNLVRFEDLAASASSPRRLNECLWGKAFIKAYGIASSSERLLMVEGLCKGAGLAFLAIPMAAPFVFSEAQFRRVLTNYLGLPGGIREPHTHHCHSNTTRTLTSATLNHICTCPVLGSHLQHDAVKDVLKHLVERLGLTDAAVTEALSVAPDGETIKADVRYTDIASGKTVILEVKTAFLTSDSSVNASARRGFDAAKSQLMAKERECREHPVIQGILNAPGNSTVFHPCVISASGGMGPHFVQFLRESYERAKVTGCWNMAAQPDIESTWNTRVASTYWDMRLSAAVAVTAADVQNRLIRRDETLNLRVMGRQPHPNPNFAAYTRSAAQPAWRRPTTPRAGAMR